MKIVYCTASIVASVICGVSIATDDKWRMIFYGIYAFSLATCFIAECNRDESGEDAEK